MLNVSVYDFLARRALENFSLAARAPHPVLIGARVLGRTGEAKKRFGLCVLDYIVTSNHVHLLVKDTGPDVIAQSMQLIAGRTAQEYNQRKGRQGAFWEDRYHATAVAADLHLHRCLVYIDLNMVRAGVVSHPGQWKESGFCEIQKPPKGAVQRL